MSSKEAWEPVLATDISGRPFEMNEGAVTRGTIDAIKVDATDYISFTDTAGNEVASCASEWGCVSVKDDGTIRVALAFP